MNRGSEQDKLFNIVVIQESISYKYERGNGDFFLFAPGKGKSR